MPDVRHSEPTIVPSVVEFGGSTSGQELSGSFASSTWAIPCFFIGWIGVGVVIAVALIRRGHDARTMLAMGAGLGPLMVVVAADCIRHRDRTASPLVLRPGDHLGGPLDVVALVQDATVDIEGLLPTIQSVQADLGSLTLARAVAFEDVEDGPEGEIARRAERELSEIAALLPVRGVTLMLLPGSVADAAERYGHRRHTLVLTAIAPPPTYVERTE